MRNRSVCFKMPGYVFSRSIKLVYGPIATTTAPCSILRLRSATALSGEPGLLVMGSGQFSSSSSVILSAAKDLSRDISPGYTWNTGTPHQAQDVVHIACSPPLVLRHGRDARDFEVGPLQKHGERAQIVHIAANVCIEMDFCHSHAPCKRHQASSGRFVHYSLHLLKRATVYDHP